MVKLVRRRRASWVGSGIIAVVVCACTASGERAASAPTEPRPGASAAALTSPLGSYLAGRHAQQQHDYGAAARYFGQALAQDPSDYELINKTFLFDLSEGRMEDAQDLAGRINRIDPAA